ncbi:MAG: biotin carboxylase N-terminal domain-containing protein [Chromatocurvus sp.]
MQPFDSVLVANRGEIAVRILATARAAGYRSIAVYSDADADAPHVAAADQAVRIGPGPAGESYLDSARILDAAAISGAQAIHPGYGFLSENAAFALAVAEAGLVWIGPPPAAIALMGSKAAAKRHMQAAGVPCLPGYSADGASDDALAAAAVDIGVPLMVKASAGGGGRGMRLVTAQADLPDALRSARSEAGNAFGDDALILEKALLNPLHVEVQVFSDSHGNHLHLGERDCSVQRRHQKVVEEAPCPVLSGTLREAMGAAAIAAAQSIDYVGAGTVEFLLDADGQFYFLEMNTRLQVEHPVTEAVTGLDLVALQLLVAAGERLPFGQADVQLNGHAIEVRLYAEDPASDFLPATGRVETWLTPGGEGIRVDAGIREGQVISPFYDPMLAKVIAHGPDRATALRRLRRALDGTVLFGFRHNRDYLRRVLDSPAFVAGEATTSLLADLAPAPAIPPSSSLLACAAVLQYLSEQRADAASGVSTALLAGWSGPREVGTSYDYGPDESAPRPVVVTQRRDALFRVSIDGTEHRVAWLWDVSPGAARLQVDAVQETVFYRCQAGGRIDLQWRGSACTLDNRLATTATADAIAGGGAVVAPMHGIVVSLFVVAGDPVARGTTVAVIEAMKMEHRLKAAIDGTVTAIHVVPRAQVATGDIVIEISPD